MAKKKTVGNLPKKVEKVQSIENVLKVGYNKENQQVTSARALWEWLGVQTRFNDWFQRRVEEYGFEEDVDFTRIILKNENNSKRGPKFLDFAIKLGMAKELSMAERTEKGRVTRKYFLKCEEVAKEQIPQLPQSFSEALRLLADKVDENRKLNLKLYITEDELNRYKDRYDGVLTRGEWARLLNKKFNLDILERRTKCSSRMSITEILAKLGITEWVDDKTEIAKQEYIDKGWFVNVKKRNKTSGYPSVVTYITAKGQSELEQKVFRFVCNSIDDFGFVTVEDIKKDSGGSIPEELDNLIGF